MEKCKKELIIFEGNELNFKTTIAHNISRKLGYEIIKGSSFEIGSLPYQKMVAYFHQIAQSSGKVVDRFLYSNLVYANQYQGFTLINEQDRKKIEDEIREKALLVYLYAPAVVLKERLAVRGDEHVEANRLEEINQAYTPFIEEAIENGIETIRINTSICTSEKATTIIMNYLSNL